ncbi:tape measure protein [Alteromonas sp. OM2203]|uniref:tape measure protein n=1 Tax=Alteromonas sp. OM2203 TaxID=3398817 RepID=UPI003AF38928
MSKSDLDIMINLLANTKGMRKEYQQAIAQQVALNKELTRGTSQATSQAGSFTTLENAVGKLDNHLKELVSQQAALNKEVSLSKQNTNAARDGLDRYEQVLEQLQREMRDVIASQSSLSRSLRTTDTSASAATRNIKQLEVQSRSLGAAVRPLGGYIAGAFGVLAAQNAAVNIKDTLSDYQQFSTRLRFLSVDTQDYANSLSFLTQLADDHGKSVLVMGESYASLAALRKGDIINQQQQYQLMTGLSNAQSALGVSTDQLGNLMYGLGQALSQPTVQTAEFNQVMEPIPGLMQSITKAAGLQGKTYRDLVLEGEVTSAMFRDDLIKALGEYDGAAKANIDNITAQENALENLRVQTIAAFEQPISDAYGTLLETTGEALIFVRDNAETLTTAVETLTAVALVRGAAALSNYGVELGRKTMAQQSATASTLAAAKKQHEHNLSLQLAAKRSLEVASNDTLRAGALTRLATANQAVIASQNALNVATAQYSVVGRTATAVARGLWAAIGGIPGVVLLGTYALYEWATSSDDAKNSTKQLNDEVKALQNTLNPFSQYTKTQAVGALQRYTGQLELAKQQAEELRKRFDNPYFKTTTEDVIAAEKEVQRLTDVIAQLQAILAKGNASNDPIVNTDEITKQREAAAKLLADLERQRVLYGQVGEEARVSYETTHGSLKDLTAAEKEALILAAKKLDSHKSDIDARTQQKNAATALKDEVDKLLAKQKEEISLYGSTSREAQVRYDIEFGALQNVNDELKKKLLLQAKELDNLAQAKALQSRVESIAVGTMTPQQREQANHKSNITDLETYRDSLPQNDLAKRQEINQLIEAEQRRHSSAMTSIQSGTKTEIDAMWSDTFDRFASGIGTATADAIFESENLGDGLRNVFQSMGKHVVATLIEIGAKRLVLAAINSTAATSEAATATAAATASGAAITASMAPAAAATTLATAGTNSIGSIAAIAAVGAAIAAMFAGLFDKGGHIPSGKFGIAGEYGPEFVKGPATVTSRVDTANILNRQAANDGGGRSVVFNDNRTINVSGGNTEEVMTQLAPILERQQQETLAKVGQQFKTGTGPVYSGYRASR